MLPELAAGATTPAVAPSGAAASAFAPVLNDAWYRLTILPGLEVHCHSAASAELQALARKVVDELRRA